MREGLAAKIQRELGPFDERHLEALRRVPRERFVRPVDVPRAAEDVPLPLDDEGLATISAPHAYLLSFRLLGLSPGDHLLELGSGTGYGAALASAIVGASGFARTVEIDPGLATCARQLLAHLPNVEVQQGDGMDVARWLAQANKVSVTFAVRQIPAAWRNALAERAVLVAPVGQPGCDQRLVRVERAGGELLAADHGAVRYVSNRSSRNV